MTLRNGFTPLCVSAVVAVTFGLLPGVSNQGVAAEDSDNAEVLSFCLLYTSPSPRDPT